MASLRASLAQLEKIARAGLVDEDMPRCVQGIFERQFDEFWTKHMPRQGSEARILVEDLRIQRQYEMS